MRITLWSKFKTFEVNITQWPEKHFFTSQNFLFFARKVAVAPEVQLKIKIGRRHSTVVKNFLELPLGKFSIVILNFENTCFSGLWFSVVNFRCQYPTSDGVKAIPHGKKGFVIPTKSFVKIGITKIFCYINKTFSSINKMFGCCSKIFGWSNKKFICCP